VLLRGGRNLVGGEIYTVSRRGLNRPLIPGHF